MALQGTKTPDLMDLDFPGTGARLVLATARGGGRRLAEGLAAVLAGWAPRTGRGRGEAPVLAAVSGGRGGRWRVRSRYLDRPTGGLPLASAVCALLADLSQDWAERRAGCIGLHCGAVRIGGRLLLLTGPARAGKTTLTARLACEPGVEFVCDDVLPVVPGPDGPLGVALGIAPRLRLPVPAGSAPLARLAAEATLLADDRYAYVAPPRRAPHGAAAPLGTIVLLDRRETGAARLHRLAPDEAVALLVRQSITDHPSAAAAFDRARAITAGLACLRLVYADLDAAAGLLHRALGPEGGLAPGVDLGPELPAPAAAPARPAAPSGRRFARNPAARLRRHGASAFLWLPGETRLWQLNAVGHAIWTLLAAPASARDLAEVLAQAFPGEAPERLVADAAALLGGLAAEGLVQPPQPTAE